MADSDLAGSPEVSQDGSSGDFISNILTPGSSLNPAFLTTVDGVLAALLLIFFGLLVLSRGSIHFIFLMFITGCLWASVKWCVASCAVLLLYSPQSLNRFVAELQSVRSKEAAEHNPSTIGKKSNSKAKDE